MRDYIISEAIDEDLLPLPEIEADAGQAFASVGLPLIAEMPPAPASSYCNLSQGSFVLVCKDTSGEILGFCLIKSVDGEAYLGEISVRRHCSGRGIGKALIREALVRAREMNYSAMALTTFRDIPFNAPFYRKLGFDIFTPDQDWPELSAIVAQERSGALSCHPRVAMIMRFGA